MTKNQILKNNNKLADLLLELLREYRSIYYTYIISLCIENEFGSSLEEMQKYMDVIYDFYNEEIRKLLKEDE